MYHSYIDLLEISYENDLSRERSRTKHENLVHRGAFSRLSERQFIKRYRLSKESTKRLVQELTPHMPPILRSDGLTIESKVLVALAFYATGSYQTIVGDSRRHCMSQASVSKAIRQVTASLNKPDILKKYISFPFKRSEREELKRDFFRKFIMPGVLGCIDGTQVAIVRPVENEERFFNRKGYHSLNVLIVSNILLVQTAEVERGEKRLWSSSSTGRFLCMCVSTNPDLAPECGVWPKPFRDGLLTETVELCDSKMNILCVDASYPGSTHDSFVWANHPLKSYIERLHTHEGEDLYLLGDSGYALRSTMMIPISDPVPNSPEAYYQELHLTARNVVERCIGLLKARFRCLLVDRKLHYSPIVAAKITNACCVLHNIAHKEHVPYTPLSAQEARRERLLTEGACGSANRAQRSALSELELGRARRAALIERLWANRSTLN